MYRFILFIWNYIKNPTNPRVYRELADNNDEHSDQEIFYVNIKINIIAVCPTNLFEFKLVIDNKEYFLTVFFFSPFLHWVASELVFVSVNQARGQGGKSLRSDCG